MTVSSQTARGRYRFRTYTLGPDRRPEASAVLFRMQCTTCDGLGPAATDSQTGTTWALDHLKAHPDHLQYAEYIVRPYRAEPGAWQ